jgi:hypothetical protein
MSAGYVDRNLVQNSALACFLLTAFVQRYEELTAKTSSPELMKLLLVLPVVWHKKSCDAIKGREFSTSLQTVLAECPHIRSQFQERVAAFSAVSCQGLNLACASGLLRQVTVGGSVCLSTTFDKWPRGSKPANVPSDMQRTVARLAVWFRDAKTAQLFGQFLRV